MCFVTKVVWFYRIYRQVLKNLKIFCKWVLTSVAIGFIVGGVGCLFYFVLRFVTSFRGEHPWMVFFLPAAGLVIVFLYHICKINEPKGTNLVITAVRSEEQIPARMAPLIFISTALTHLCGGSAGREGAALQLGGSLGEWIAKVCRVKEEYKNVAIMCGMSAAFSALFGTPVAATIFAMELVSVGVMYYTALVPCAISSIIASLLAKHCGIVPESFTIIHTPGITAVSIVKVAALGVVCAGVSILLCYSLHTAGKLYKKYLPNQYVRAMAGGLLVVALAFVFRTQDYLGAGMNIIEESLQGDVRPQAFLLKILFTAVTLGAGFKGGEIVPSFFVGATFGCVMGQLIGLEPSLAAAIGMMTVFCGVTNCPVTALMMSFELFGFTTPSFFLIAIPISYMLSGYYSLYSAQRIVYAKTKPKYVNQKTH
ncbi:chloride channel protein [Youxingia wuxianensis]|uniref:Chloride channel protein n=1 Tax=Youxingia wuxianensis TaxID=2763678 RepID=A0A926IBG7_9FIRM|nr:chloride channel protein [Youxingia wuxianensis]